jgi:hypothetical protein
LAATITRPPACHHTRQASPAVILEAGRLAQNRPSMAKKTENYAEIQ